jgi:NADPH-dependent 7-cyano-7-deazaguanine reductase QueF
MAANTNNTDINALANAIVSALQNAKLEVKMDSTFSGGGMNNPRYM